MELRWARVCSFRWRDWITCTCASRQGQEAGGRGPWWGSRGQLGVHRKRLGRRHACPTTRFSPISPSAGLSITETGRIGSLLPPSFPFRFHFLFLMATPSPTPRRRTTRSSAAANKTVDVKPVATSAPTDSTPAPTPAPSTTRRSSTTTRRNAASGSAGSGSVSKPVANAASSASPVQGIALGMIETRGMVPAIEAADAMTKAAVA